MGEREVEPVGVAPRLDQVGHAVTEVFRFGFDHAVPGQIGVGAVTQLTKRRFQVLGQVRPVFEFRSA